MYEHAAIGSRMDDLLELLWHAGGTDLLLTVGARPLIRVHGDLVPAPGHDMLSGHDTDALLEELLTPLAADGRKVIVPFAPFEIQTLKLGYSS